MLNLAVDHINRLKPRFVAIGILILPLSSPTSLLPSLSICLSCRSLFLCLSPQSRCHHAHLSAVGDLVNKPPSTKPSSPSQSSSSSPSPSSSSSSPDAGRAQVAALKLALSRVASDIPLVLLSGNHDIGNNADMDSIHTYTSAFGDDFFSFKHGGVEFVCLNTQLFKLPDNCSDAARAHAHAQNTWLEHLLSTPLDDSTSYRVMFGHIAPFLTHVAEPSGYFNLPQDARARMIDLASRGRVKAWFSGHYHRNAWVEDPASGIKAVTVSASGTALHTNSAAPAWSIESCGPPDIGGHVSGLCVVRAGPDDVTYDFYTMDSVPDKLT